MVSLTWRPPLLTEAAGGQHILDSQRRTYAAFIWFWVKQWSEISKLSVCSFEPDSLKYKSISMKLLNKNLIHRQLTWLTTILSKASNVSCISLTWIVLLHTMIAKWWQKWWQRWLLLDILALYLYNWSRDTSAVEFWYVFIYWLYFPCTFL